MNIIEDFSAAKYQIKGYKPGCIRINDEEHCQSLIITPDKLYLDWPPQQPDELTASHFDVIIATKPEVILLGTGPEQVFLSPTLYQSVLAKQIGIEIMNTLSACRTYQVLTSEGRAVAAAMIL